jgi:RNA polymerase sigma-70 factor (ECF subfamily)
MEHEGTEYELALRARDGDREALSELVERSRVRLFAMAYADLRHYEDAQDVVAAALLRICRHIGELREPERVRGWMQSVVRNEVRRRIQSRAGEPVGLPDAEAATAPEARASLMRLDVELALRRLPRDQARTVALFYLDRRPIDEIARLTNRPEGTIKRWLHLGRRQLAREMEAYAPMNDTHSTPTEMPARWSAAILASEFDAAWLDSRRQHQSEEEWTKAAPRSLRQLIDGLEAAGFTDVTTFDDLRNLVAPTIEDGTRHWNLNAALRGKHLIVLDDAIQGHNVFEVLTVLKAVPELQDVKYLLMLGNPKDFSVLASWTSGVDCLLTKPMDIDEFIKFCGRMREALAEEARKE